MKNWWHVRCVHFMTKLLIYKQLWLSYSKLSMLIFATFQFFMFWFNTNFVKWKFQFRNSLFDLKWKNESKKISFISQIWLSIEKEKTKKKKQKKNLFWFKISFKKQNSKFDFKSKNEFRKVLSFFNFGYEIEKWKIFKIHFVFKSKNELYFRYMDFWCFLSQLQHRNENENFISNLSKKRNGTFGTRIHWLHPSASVYENVHFIFAQFSITSKKWKLILGNVQFNF